MSNTVIENYEPDDQGWGVVIGRFAQPPPLEDDDSSADSRSQPSEEERSSNT